MRKQKILLIMLSFFCVLVVGIGFAAIQTVLRIEGTVSVEPGDFDVRFESGDGYTVTTSKKEGDTVIISDRTLMQSGEISMLNIKIKNYSIDYIAEFYLDDMEIEITTTTDADINDISIEIYSMMSDENGKVTIEPGSTTTIIFAVALNKAQIDTEVYNFKITFEADAVVPE